jgi:hypothetical protein
MFDGIEGKKKVGNYVGTEEVRGERGWGKAEL